MKTNLSSSKRQQLPILNEEFHRANSNMDNTYLQSLHLQMESKYQSKQHEKTRNHQNYSQQIQTVLPTFKRPTHAKLKGKSTSLLREPFLTESNSGIAIRTNNKEKTGRFAKYNIISENLDSDIFQKTSPIGRKINLFSTLGLSGTDK